MKSRRHGILSVLDIGTCHYDSDGQPLLIHGYLLDRSESADGEAAAFLRTRLESARDAADAAHRDLVGHMIELAILEVGGTRRDH